MALGRLPSPIGTATLRTLLAPFTYIVGHANLANGDCRLHNPPRSLVSLASYLRAHASDIANTSRLRSVPVFSVKTVSALCKQTQAHEMTQSGHVEP